MTNPPSHRAPRHLWMYGVIVMLVVALYGQTAWFDFVNFDDGFYVTRNAQVQQGLSVTSLLWAFRDGGPGSWHPLTMISHMTDVILFGMNPGGHHVVNVLFHIINAVLVLYVLHRMTGAFWPSGLVAALFAVHPQHVESVAWISERKDVLSMFFALLTLDAYRRYTEGSTFHYGLALIWFALGLMAKPMLVTLPFLILLLDYWPLNRLTWRTAARRGAEKIPFFLLTVLFVGLTLWAQTRARAVSSIESLPWTIRASNAVVSYAAYLRQTVWPTGLAAYYPHPLDTLTAVHVAGAAGVMMVITVIALVFARRAPYAIVGWLWFVGSLVPVIGLVQVGTQAMADRYMYLPHLGLFMAAAWAANDLIKRWPRTRHAVVALAALCVLALSSVCFAQTRHWRDSEALFRRMLAVTENNTQAHMGLAQALYDRGDDAEAVKHLQAALAIDGSIGKAFTQLGIIAEKYGQMREAEQYYRDAIARTPGDARAVNNLAIILTRQGKTDEAYALLYAVLERNPLDMESATNLTAVLIVQRRYAEAENYTRSALRRWPLSVRLINNLGVALRNQGRLEEARSAFEQALIVDPDNVEALSNLNALTNQMHSGGAAE